MTKSPAHPTLEELSAFNLGQLSDEGIKRVETHIGECHPCCETLLGLSSDDTFVELLQEANLPPSQETLDQLGGSKIKSAARTGEIPPSLLNHPRYNIIGPVGHGGMGDVFRAEHRLMERTVALKVIKQEIFRRPEVVQRFQREVTTAAKLSHPNIVTAYDAEQAGDVHYLVMEYVPGDNLSDVVKRDGPLDIAKACNFVMQAANGLQHAHEAGMVHRDIKPHNLMVTSDGQVKILDFGLATLTEAALPNEDNNEAPPRNTEHGTSPALTSAGSMMGTPDFISPEQASDARAADIRSDIYSLGCTLYYLLTGRPPFTEGSALERVKAHEDVEPEAIENVRVDIPEEVADVVRRMMAKNPDDRFQSPADVADALARFVDAYRTAPPEKREGLRGNASRGIRSWWPPTLAQSLGYAAFALVLGAIVYVVTDHGTLQVKSKDENVQITVRPVNEDSNVDSPNSELQITDTITGSTIKRLPSGEYVLDVKGDNNSFELDKNRFVLRRGDRIIVTVTRKNTAMEAISPQLDAGLAGRGKDSPRTRNLRRVFVSKGTSSFSGEIFPDGQRMSMVDWGNNGNLAIRDLITGEVRRVTRNTDWSDGYAMSSKPSPDGKRIACCWAVESTNHCQLRVIDAETGNHKILYDNPDKSSYLEPRCWFPDGESIVVAVNADVSQNQLMTFSVKDESQRVLRPLDWRWPETASVSPDGRYLVYDLQVNDDAPDRNLFLMATDGSSEIEITSHPQDDTKPLWTPDGRGIVFISDRSGREGLYFLEVTDGQPVGKPILLVENMRPGKPIGFTSAGAYYFTTSFSWRGDIYVANLGTTDGQKAESERQLIQQNEGFNSLPCWSSDGKRLAYTLSGEYLVIREIETANEQKIRLSPRLKLKGGRRIQWTSTNSVALYGYDFKGRRGLFSIDTQSGDVTPLVHGPPEEFFIPQFRFSPDGMTAYYLRSRDVVARDLDSGKERIIHQANYHSLALSSDGQQLALASDRAIELLSTVDDSREQLYKVADEQVIPAHVGIAWTDSDNSIIFASADATSYHPKWNAPRSNVWRVSVDNKSVTSLGVEIDGLRQMSVHPDGHQIAYSKKPLDGGAEVWGTRRFLATTFEAVMKLATW